MGILSFVVPEAEAAAEVDCMVEVTAAKDLIAEEVQNESGPAPKKK